MFDIRAGTEVDPLATQHQHTSAVIAKATVHGYATASGVAAGIMVLAALLAGILINVHPGRSVETDAPGAPVGPVALAEQTGISPEY